MEKVGVQVLAETSSGIDVYVPMGGNLLDVSGGAQRSGSFMVSDTVYVDSALGGAGAGWFPRRDNVRSTDYPQVSIAGGGSFTANLFTGTVSGNIYGYQANPHFKGAFIQINVITNSAGFSWCIKNDHAFGDAVVFQSLLLNGTGQFHGKMYPGITEQSGIAISDLLPAKPLIVFGAVGDLTADIAIDFLV